MMNRPPLDAIVFDYDGVLADTHGLWDQAYAALFARYGAQPAPADRRRLATLGTTALGHALAELLGGIAPPGLLADEITSLVTCNLGRPVSPMPGAVPLVTALAGKTPLGVASNSPGKIVRSHLSQIGLADRFQAVVGIDDVPAPKPAPDPYRTACALLGKRPQACTAIEDSQQGISSATTAGLYVIGIQTSGDSLEADAVYSSLTDPGLWQVLLESRTFRTAGLPPPASGGTRTRRRAGSVSGGVPSVAFLQRRGLVHGKGSRSPATDRTGSMGQGFAASQIDTSRPHPARMYDAYLGARTTIPWTGKLSGRSCAPGPKSA